MDNNYINDSQATGIEGTIVRCRKLFSRPNFLKSILLARMFNMFVILRNHVSRELRCSSK